MDRLGGAVRDGARERLEQATVDADEQTLEKLAVKYGVGIVGLCNFDQSRKEHVEAWLRLSREEGKPGLQLREDGRTLMRLPSEELLAVQASRDEEGCMST